MAGFAVLGLVLALCAVGLSGCKSTKSSDTANPTPPTLHWSVHNLATEDTQEFAGDARMTVNDGESVRIVLKAEAPGGIRRIRMSGDGAWTCHGSGLVQTQSKGDGQEEETFTTAPTHAFLIHDTNFSAWECNPGFGNPTGHFTFQGEGENITPGGSSGTTKSVLGICNSRGC